MIGALTPCLAKRLFLCLLIVFGAAALALQAGAENTDTRVRTDLATVFEEHGVVGTFVAYDVSGNQMTLVNADRARMRFVPASTFKVANSLIALETGVVKSENEIIPYGGEPQPVKTWEQDMSLRDAIPVSNVPVYQQIARRIGLDRYRKWLARLDYGNRNVGTVVDQFWLRGPLKITAIEQASFMGRLAQQALSAEKRTQLVVRDIIRFERNDAFAIYAKTGWSRKIGWWTGWVERNERIYAFAVNIDMATAADAPKRIAIGKAILSKLGMLD